MAQSPAPTPAQAGTSAPAAAPAAGRITIAEPVPGVEHAELGRADVMALGIGLRIGTGGLVVACLLAIMLGAGSILSSLQATEQQLLSMSENLGAADEGLDVLLESMEAVGPTAGSMTEIITAIEGMEREIAASRASMEQLERQVSAMGSQLEGIDADTRSMQQQIGRVDQQSATLGRTVTEVSGQLGPMVAAQDQMLGNVRQMRDGTWTMNDSLAYVIRILNYMAAPPNGRPFMIQAEPGEGALPPVPGVRAETAPVQVFPRQPWPTYRGR